MKAMGATGGFDTMKTLGKTVTLADIVRLLKFIVFISCSSFLPYLLTLRKRGLTFSQKKKHKLFLCGTLDPPAQAGFCLGERGCQAKQWLWEKNRCPF